MKRRIVILLLVLGLATGLRAADLAAGWRALADYRAEDALAIFAAAARDPAPAVAREARFGRAVALLARQPVTPAQIGEAAQLFEALAAEGDATWSPAAEFYLARIAQHHQAAPDPAAAATHFRRLLERWPDTVWGQSAVSRLALLELYAPAPGRDPARRVAEAEKLVPRAHDPAARMQVELALGDAILFYRLPAATALPHLLAAERTGRLESVVRQDVLVQIAELSRLQGLNAQAGSYYEQFLQEFPRDQRHYMVKQRLAALRDGKVAP